MQAHQASRPPHHQRPVTPGSAGAEPPAEPRYEDLPTKALEREIERISPEGKPAHPEMGPRRLGFLLVGLAALILLVGVAVAILVDVTGGIVVAALGLALFLVSPGFWATIFRARERAVAQHRVEDRGAGAAQPPRDSS